MTTYIVPLDQATRLDLVGGKAHNLYRVRKLDLKVPDGFVVTTSALKDHIEEIHALSERATRIRDLITNTPLSAALRELLHTAAEELLDRGPVVVRSSA